MIKKTLPIILIMLCSLKAIAGYDYTPALVHLDDRQQHDSLGFNLVEEIPKLLYSKILDGQVTLWDSPSKQIKISGEALMSIENKSGTSFLSLKNLFINEFWQMYKRKFNFQIMGFSFINKNFKNEKISYGFVDMQEIQDLIQASVLPNNANGTAQLTYWEALMSKDYPFDLVQFGNVNLKNNPNKAFQIYADAFENPKIKTNRFKIDPKKELRYIVLPTRETDNIENGIFYKTLEAYLNDNKQIVLNQGGSEFFNYLQPNAKYNVDRIEVVETWIKEGDLIRPILSEITFFINGKPIILDSKAIEELDMKVKFQNISEYLSGKSFDFVIRRINHQDIGPFQSAIFYKRLLNFNWNRITFI